ncbi:MAG: ATP-binding protein [Kiritimatiellae bacterium]|jgi:predicted AAA+ superfamily ATPase|nr:ATP-binding protein [Kiritimatiellia bacterium]
MHINRVYDSQIRDKIVAGKVLIIYGARRVGKTTLIKKFLSNCTEKYYWGTGEDRLLQEVLESCDVQKIVSAFSAYDLIGIDEAQYIKNIGMALKILVDHLPDKKIIVSGSSSFELSNQIGQPLTGRQKIMQLFPVAFMELSDSYGYMDALGKLEELLVFGSYPEVLTTKNIPDKVEYLMTLSNSYLFQDILKLENIRNSSKLADLLKLLAFQVGKEVSLNELSNSLGIAKQTVERYIDLLEKSFIIKKISGFSRNLRKEVTKISRYFFWDNGVRNALINNFNYLDSRDDVGMLWENFLTIERLKKQTYQSIYSNNYFWRTYEHQEIDWVEDRQGTLFGYEFKWGNKNVKPPSAWVKAYPEAEYKIINRENFTDFIV